MKVQGSSGASYCTGMVWTVRYRSMYCTVIQWVCTAAAPPDGMGCMQPSSHLRRPQHRTAMSRPKTDQSSLRGYGWPAHFEQKSLVACHCTRVSLTR